MESQPIINRTILPWWRLVTLSFYAFPVNFQKALFSLILFPRQVVYYTSNDSKGISFAYTLVLSGLLAALLVPFVGTWSDQTKTWLGKRRPWIFVFVHVNCLSIFGLMLSPNLGWFIFACSVNGFSSVVLFCIFPTVIGDLVPENQQGSANGWMVFFENAGSLSGCVLGVFSEQIGTNPPGSFYFWSYLIVLFLMYLSWIAALVFINEQPTNITQPEIYHTEDCVSDNKNPPSPNTLPQGPNNNKISDNNQTSFLQKLLQLLKCRDFMLLCFIAMLSLGLIQSIMQDYFQYYILDNISLPTNLFSSIVVTTSETAASYFSMTNYVGGLFALLVGNWSDTYAYKNFQRYLIIVFGLVLQIPFPLTMMYSRNLDIIIGVSLVYGFGGAIVRAIGLSCVQITLSQQDANLIGFGNGLFIVLAFAIPIVTTLLDGWIIDYFHEGYVILYWLAIGYIGLGVVLGLVLVLGGWTQKKKITHV